MYNKHLLLIEKGTILNITLHLYNLGWAAPALVINHWFTSSGGNTKIIFLLVMPLGRLIIIILLQMYKL